MTRRALAAVALLLLLPGAASAAVGREGVLLSQGTLSTFDPATPGTLSAPIALGGVVAGDELVALAERPATGGLYALGSNSGAGTVRLYAVSARGGWAEPLGAPIAMAGTAFGMDFNPTADRVRVVSSSGANARLNAQTGALVANDVALNGGSTSGDGVAYTNGSTVAPATSMYVLDSVTDKVFRTVPPNGGTLVDGVALRSGAAPVDVSAASGFDLAPDVTVATANAAATGQAVAALTVGGEPRLAVIDLASGNVAFAGRLGDGTRRVDGLVLRQERAEGALPAVTLAFDGLTLSRFETTSPAERANVTVTGVPAGQQLVGIDLRPQTGQLLAFAVNAVAQEAQLHVLDPVSGAATPIGVPFSLTGTGFPDGGYGVDVNPTVDRVRVTNQNGLNFRVNPNTGAPVDGDAGTAGVQPDAALNGAATGGAATAYTNAFGRSLAVPGVTTQLTLDATTRSLYVQSPPNLGTLGNGRVVSTTPFTEVAGFDLAPSVAVTTANAAPTGTGYAVLTNAGGSRLDRIDLARGAAQTLAALPAPTSGLAVSDGPPPAPTPAPVPPAQPPATPDPGPVTPLPLPGVVLGKFGTTPKVTVKLAATRIAGSGPVRVTLRNANAFPVRVRLTGRTARPIRVRGQKRRRSVALKAVSATVPANASRTVRVALPAAVARVLRADKRVALRLSLTLRDPSGTSRVLTKVVAPRLRR